MTFVTILSNDTIYSSHHIKNLATVKDMKILAGYDGSNNAERALDEAINVAKAFKGTITVLTVFDPLDTEAKGLKLLDDIEKTKLEKAGVNYELRTAGSEEIAYTICKIAKAEGFDLIAIGRKGVGIVHTWLYGSVADKVFNATPCPILIVP